MAVKRIPSRSNQRIHGEPGRILVLTHYYPPETNAPANRVSEFARHWAGAGHNVHIVTGMPNHPSGHIPGEYRRIWYRCEHNEGVTVHRGRIYPAPNRGRVRRILNYLSFMVSGTITALWKAPPPDCVIATSPQMFCGVAGWLVAAVRRVPFIFEVRDIWPEEIVAVGAIRNRLVIRLLEWLEMFLYRRADRIVVVAQGSVEILTARGIMRDKLALIPNGVDTSLITPGDRHNAVRDANDLNGDFLVSYIGTVGMAHRLEVVLGAAERLREEKRIKFMIVGDGAERERLQQLARQNGLDNILWESPQPRNRIADYYRAADACLVHMRKADLFTRNIPSKIYEIMAAGRPVLLGAQGESQDLAAEAGCAVTFAPEDAGSLSNAIRELASAPERAARMGAAGRRFVTERYDRAQLAQIYLDIIHDTTRHPAMTPAGGAK